MVAVGLWAAFRKPSRLSPALIEAAAGIIHAAPSTESKGNYRSLFSIRQRVVVVWF